VKGPLSLISGEIGTWEFFSIFGKLDYWRLLLPFSHQREVFLCVLLASLNKLEVFFSVQKIFVPNSCSSSYLILVMMFFKLSPIGTLTSLLPVGEEVSQLVEIFEGKVGIEKSFKRWRGVKKVFERGDESLLSLPDQGRMY
jgi:hypothetical protein